MHRITYKNIRNNCQNPKRANFCKTGIKAYCDGFSEFKKECIDNFDWNNKFEGICYFLWCIALLLLVYISLPIYILSRLATILYPYFIKMHMQI